VQGILTPHVQLTHACSWAPGYGDTSDKGNQALLMVQFAGSPPSQGGVSATWTDGEKSFFGRFVAPSVITTYTIASVSIPLNICPAVFDTPQSYTYHPGPVPDITFPVSSICGGTVGTASVTPPPPGTQVNWTVAGGSIVSGQGTSTIQYQAGSSTQVHVTCTFTFSDPNRCPLTGESSYLPIVPFDPSGSVSVNPNQIYAGKTADVSFSFSKDTVNWSISNTLNDPITIASPCFVDPTDHTTHCHGVYTSTHGPGQSTVTVHFTSNCGGTKDVSVPLTIAAN
jgi:hypothetical protein